MSTAPTTATRTLAALALTVPLAFGAVACSSDEAADKIAEKIIESGAGKDVDVDYDSDSGSFTVDSDDGSMSFSPDGGELSENWPSEIPMPDDFKVTGTFETTTDGEQSFHASGTVPGDVKAAFEDVVAAFAADGWNEEHKSTTSFDGVDTSTAMFDNGTWNVVISATDGLDGADDFTYMVSTASS